MGSSRESTVEDPTMYQDQASMRTPYQPYMTDHVQNLSVLNMDAGKNMLARDTGSKDGQDAHLPVHSVSASKSNPPKGHRGEKRAFPPSTEDLPESSKVKTPRTKRRRVMTTDGVLEAEQVVQYMKSLRTQFSTLESRVEALEDEKMELLGHNKKWAEMNEEFMRNYQDRRHNDGVHVKAQMCEDWIKMQCDYLSSMKYIWVVQSKRAYLAQISFGIPNSIEEFDLDARERVVEGPGL